VDESREFGEPLPASDLFSEESFGTRLSRQAGVLWLAMGGELDVFTASELRAALREAKPGPTETLVLDLRGLGFIDSSGLAVILGVHEEASRDEANPVKIVIKGSAAVEALFELIGAGGYLDLIESADDLDGQAPTS
jgi:anti-sigma B factor antagonist